VLIGCGSNSRVLLDLLLLSGREVVVIDQDPRIIEAQRSRGIPAVRGDGSDPRVLDAAHVRRARAVVSTMRRLADNERLCQHLKTSATAASAVPRIFVRTFDDVDVTALERLGARAISEAQAAADEFLSSM
jgi:Trk K+ transport system NAD-binding subunit